MSKLRKYFFGCFSNSALSQRALASAIKKGESIEIFKERLRHVKDIDAILPVSGLTPLELAIKERNSAIVKALLERGADVTRSTTEERTPLLRACELGCLNSVKALVEHGADLTAKSKDGLTCLILAAKTKHLSVVSYLLEQKSCPVDGVWNGGITALHCLVQCTNQDLASELINKGVDVNVQTQTGETPLFLAAKSNRIDSLKALLESKADPNIHTKLGESPFQQAMSHGNKEAMEMLLAAGADTEHKCELNWTPLLRFCTSGSFQEVKLLVAHGADPGARTSCGLSCLFVAAKYKHKPVVSYLLKQESCKFEDIDEKGHTLLHHVVKLNDSEVTSNVIDKGVNIDAQNQSGETPLFLAAKHNHPASLKVLLKSGADPNITTNNGESVLAEAVTNGRVEMVLSLLNHGADSTAFDNSGQSPVQLAMEVVIAHKQSANPPQPYIFQVVDTEQQANGLETFNTVTETVSNVAGLLKTIFVG